VATEPGESDRKVVSIHAYLLTHPSAGKERKSKDAKTSHSEQPYVGRSELFASVTAEGDVTFDILRAHRPHVRPMLLACMVMCVRLAKLMEGVDQI
jgi:hypothetical protein